MREWIYIKGKVKFKIILYLMIIIVISDLFLFYFDKIVTPTVLAAGDAEMRAKAMEIVNTVVLNEYSKEFNYDDIIHIEKDTDGNIVMLRADTLKMNKIACDVSLKSQDALKSLGNVGISIPMGYIFKNNIIAYFGPNITIKMQPIGSIETKYVSQFESAGINQTRHKIYIHLKTDVRILLPMKSNDLTVENEIPVAETIIVGKIPDSAIQLDLNGAGYKTNNKK